MEEEFMSFIESISTSAATKMEAEKITPDLLPDLTDVELKTYFPQHGDRLRVRAYVRNKGNKAKQKNKLLTVLKDKIEKSNKTREKRDSSTDEEMRNPHRGFGNKNATKDKRQIEVGWIHKTHQRSTQVRKKKGGGTRKIEMHKNSTKQDILDEALKLFFPNQLSPKGHASQFQFDVWDFSDRTVKDDVTIKDMYEETKMPLLRFYLASSSKEVVNEDSETDLPSLTTRTTETSISASSQPPVASTTSQLSLVDSNLPVLTGDDILASAIHLSGLIADDEDFLPDLAYIHQEDEAIPVKEITIKLHRGHLLKEMINEFKDIDPVKDIVNIQMIMPNGDIELAEDGGGVTRDALSEYWSAFYDECTTGTTYKIPYLRHDFAEKEWDAVANIIVFGWKSTGYFPVQLSLPFLQQCLFGKVTANILDSFFGIIPEVEATTLKTALEDFDAVDMDEMLDILDTHESKVQPTAKNISNILQEIAHKEIIQTPMFITDCMHPKLVSLGLSEDQLAGLHSELLPTNKNVTSMLVFPVGMSHEEHTVSNHLKRLIRELNKENLQKFVRFCTGSHLLVKREIKVEFVNVYGLARRPVAHTCSCVLELSKTYESFPEFRKEFMSVLEHSVWVMDII